MREVLYWFCLTLAILASRDTLTVRRWGAHALSVFLLAVLVRLLRRAIVEDAQRSITPPASEKAKVTG